jgi:hypothetical protein
VVTRLRDTQGFSANSNFSVAPPGGFGVLAGLTGTGAGAGIAPMGGMGTMADKVFPPTHTPHRQPYKTNPTPSRSNRYCCRARRGEGELCAVLLFEGGA